MGSFEKIKEKKSKRGIRSLPDEQFGKGNTGSAKEKENSRETKRLAVKRQEKTVGLKARLGGLTGGLL